MREAVIVASSRTALAKSFRGSFNLTRPDDLAAHCIQDVLRKIPQLDASEVEDVILGCGQPHGPQGHNIARVSALLAGLPTWVGGVTLNRFCSSGLQSIAFAAYQIVNGGSDVIIAGGVESISVTTRNHDPNPRLLEKLPGVYMVMGETAEVVAKRYKIGRQVQDEYALLSQHRTARAQQEGFFEEEIAPMRVLRATLDKKTNEVIAQVEVCADKDECNRPDTTLEGLLALKPHFDPASGQGTVTAGNSSQLSDGASATLVMSRQRADELDRVAGHAIGSRAEDGHVAVIRNELGISLPVEYFVAEDLTGPSCCPEKSHTGNRRSFAGCYLLEIGHVLREVVCPLTSSGRCVLV